MDSRSDAFAVDGSTNGPDSLGQIDPSLTYLFSLARNPTRSGGVDNEMTMRTRIMSIKVGSEGRIEAKEARGRNRKRTDRPVDAAASAKQSERAERRKPKKRKTMKRCTSPSHFAVDVEEEIRFGDDYTLDLPSRERMDLLLRSVASHYYRPKESHPNQTSVWVDAEYDQTQYPTLDLLLSPLRKTSAREHWSNKEIAIFESGMCKTPKDFRAIAALIKTKNTSQVVNFYYTFWKHHLHYKLWKSGANRDQAMQEALARGTARPAKFSPLPPASAQTINNSASSTSASPPPATSSSSSSTFTALSASLTSSLQAARDESTSARIRVKDPKSGKESWFILPEVADDAAGRVLQKANAELERAREANEESSEGDEATAPYKCCCAVSANSSEKCNKKFLTLNALGAHLRQTHAIGKGSSVGSENFVEYDL